MRVVFIAGYIAFFYVWLSAAPSGDWHFDELGDASTPFTANDEVPTNSDGTAFAINTTGNGAGKVCSAFDLTPSGTSDMVVLDPDSISGAHDFTVSVWLKNTSGAARALLSGARSGQGNALLFWFSSPTSFKPHFDNSIVSFTIPTVATSTWRHFVFRRSGNIGCVIIDGNVGAPICKTVPTTTINVSSWILGQEQDCVGGCFDPNQDWEGLVDELLIFKSALSNTQILDIYNNHNAGKNYDGTTRTCQTTPPSVDMNYAEYRFDALAYTGSPGEVKDSHWNKDGTPHSVQTTEGKICKALDLRTNGTSDYVELPSDLLSATINFTISVWHKGSPSSDSNALLSGANASQDNEILFWFTNPTTFRPHINGSNRYIPSPNINDNHWHHLVWRQTGVEACYFFDGVKKGCKSFSAAHVLSIGRLFVGQEQDCMGGCFDPNQDWEGVLDELVIFRRALSDSEIQSIYAYQQAGKNLDGTNRTCPYPTVQKGSCVILDPVNGNNNPKRIPGATIRYAIEVANRFHLPLQNVLISDTLSNDFNASSIRNLQIKSGSCNCPGVASASNNPPPGTGNGVNPVVLNFGTIGAGSLGSPTKECGYFEVDIK